MPATNSATNAGSIAPAWITPHGVESAAPSSMQSGPGSRTTGPAATVTIHTHTSFDIETKHPREVDQSGQLRLTRLNHCDLESGNRTISTKVVATEKEKLVVEITNSPSHLTDGAECHLVVATKDDPNSLELDAIVDHVEISEPTGTKRLHLRAANDLAATRIWSLYRRNRSHCNNHPSANATPPNPEAPEVPCRGHYTEAAKQARLEFLQAQTQTEIQHLGETTLDAQALTGNIEAFIGAIQIPVGIAGPLLIKGDYANGVFYAPFACTEGALVASTTRGALAVTQGGGVRAKIVGQRMVRCPGFKFQTMDQAALIGDWFNDHLQQIREIAEAHSNHAKLKGINTRLHGRVLITEFVYETGEASGQNMTTSCTWQACKWIKKRIAEMKDVELLESYIESNFSHDKKLAYNSLLNGRGIHVIAEATIPREICLKVFKTSPEAIAAYTQTATLAGQAVGMVGMNGNVANVIAALFTATGQDIASVHESTVAHLHLELTRGGDIYLSLKLPSLVIGTIGGGTKLPHQRECLQILGCSGIDSSKKLAEIIAGYALALDLSTIAAITTDQFARSHEVLGRNRPRKTLRAADLTPKYFTKIFEEKFGSQPGRLLYATPLKKWKTGGSIITETARERIGRHIGLFAYKFEYSDSATPIAAMVKIKPTDDETLLIMKKMAALCSDRLADAFEMHRESLELRHGHIREIEMLRIGDPRFVKHIPKVLGLHADPNTGTYLTITELLSNVELLDSIDKVHLWKSEHVKAAISAIADIHAIWYGIPIEIPPWMANAPTARSVGNAKPLWDSLLRHAFSEFPKFFPGNSARAIKNLSERLDEIYEEIDLLPKTLIHNDFNPRNICFRSTPGDLQPVIYDWELATYGLPQRDLAELLVMTQPPSVERASVDIYIEHHRQVLATVAGQSIEATQWRRGYQLSLIDLTLRRIPLYLMGHTFHQYDFLERVVPVLLCLLNLEGLLGEVPKLQEEAR